MDIGDILSDPLEALRLFFVYMMVFITSFLFGYGITSSQEPDSILVDQCS